MANLMLNCNICAKPFSEPVYMSSNNLSIDSLGKNFSGTTKVYFCNNCGHLQTMELENVEKFYSENYNFLIEQEEEDQLYRVVNGKPIYRQDHQIATLLDKIQLSHQACVLDYGCGKGAFLKKLLLVRPDIIPHFFDVSEVYVPFWRGITKSDNWATFSPKPDWVNSFDVVFSLFSLEHITNPKQIVTNIAKLLKPEGLFYIIVPNPYGIYIADFLVIDHVNHYSESSIRTLLNSSGFQIVEIDTQSHDVAFIVIAKKANEPSNAYLNRKDTHIPVLKTRVEKISNFWYEACNKIQIFEKEHAECDSAAIYGAGVCGSFIASCLKDPSKVKCFIDQNPYKQQQKIQGKPVVPLTELDPQTHVIYVGLNPLVARKAMESIDAWKDRNHFYFYL